MSKIVNFENGTQLVERCKLPNCNFAEIKNNFVRRDEGNRINLLESKRRGLATIPKRLELGTFGRVGAKLMSEMPILHWIERSLCNVKG